MEAGSGGPRPAARELLRALLPALGLLALLLYADVRGDFPLNDDFQYANSVRTLCAGGGVRLSPWALASSVAHVALGSIACLVSTPSNGNLRLLMAGLGCLLCWAFFLFLRRLGLSPGKSLAGSLLLAFDPLFAAMSASFHLELTALLFQLGGLWCFLESLAHLRGGDALFPALERRCDALLLAASSFCALGYLARQTALLSLAGAAALLYFEGRLTRRRLALLLAPAAVALAAYSAWYHLIHGPTWAHQALRPALFASAAWKPSRWGGLLLELNGDLQTLALLLCPLVFAAADRSRRAPGRREALALAAVVALAAAGWWAEGGMPLLENTFNRKGLGVATLNAPEAKTAGWWGSRPLWLFFDAAALLSALGLVRLIFRRREGAWREAALAAYALPPALAFLLFSENYDRYLLGLLPAAAACVLLRAEGFSGRRAAAGLLAGALLTGAGLKDYFAWNRARWQAGLHGMALGVPPERIENGFDWDGQFTLERNMRLLASRKRPEAIGMWEWMGLNRVVLATSFSPEPPGPGFARVARFPYRTPLAPDEQSVYLFGYSPRGGSAPSPP